MMWWFYVLLWEVERDEVLLGESVEADSETSQMLFVTDILNSFDQQSIVVLISFLHFFKIEFNHNK